MKTRKGSGGEARNLESGRALRSPRGIKHPPLGRSHTAAPFPWRLYTSKDWALTLSRGGTIFGRPHQQVLPSTGVFLGNFDPNGYVHKHNNAHQGGEHSPWDRELSHPPTPRPRPITHHSQFLQPITLHGPVTLPGPSPTLSTSGLS